MIRKFNHFFIGNIPEILQGYKPILRVTDMFRQVQA